ncbi:MAG: hypothetical protein PHQ84_05155 [Candidatus Omnitrophica bacterium]|jgi:hypothetical protein|nr:hypothetical protein [Candidatus Omnitrophota bacterium]MDD5078370.1 hypothetical protein [Candidatus Omnitrophota bacterium]
MKKITAILFIAVFLSGMGILGFVKDAAARNRIVRGRVVAIDLPSNTIVVRDTKTQQDSNVVVDSAYAASLKVGDTVQVELSAGGSADEVQGSILKKKSHPTWKE